ncbi:MAG: tetratricopeptide repeat protein [Roseiflexaceae bacterium]
MPKLYRPRQVAGPPDPRQQGLRSFHAQRFDDAIRLWSPLAAKDPRVRAALAEAFFRRALRPTLTGQTFDDLRQAITLAPNEARYHYHLGMNLHRTGDLAGAITSYRAVLQRDANWRGAGMLLALASLEQNPRADLSAAPGSTPQIRAALAPVQSLLLGTARLPDGDALARLWRGLALIDAGDGAARAALDDDRPLPAAQFVALRRYYKGVAAAQAGDIEAALKLWQQVYAGGTFTTTLLDNLATLLFQQLSAQLAAGDLAGATATVEQSLDTPFSGGAFDEARVQVLDRAARDAAANGDWARAVALWEGARRLVSANSTLGSPRPLLHNLALAYEAQEQWIEAAEAWRGMLRTRPRQKGDQPPADQWPNTEQWAWVRKRVIDCYKHAGRPDEAVAVFRQAIKADPDDLEMRVQLADALLANEQEQAAYNEIQRVLEIDPRHTEALLRNSAMLSARGMWPASEQILRELVARYPENEKLRRQLAQTLLVHGSQYLQSRQNPAAIKALTEGQQLDPENYEFPLNLARAQFNQRKPKQAREQLGHAIELAGDQPAAYIQIFECWVIEDQIDEARAVLARAEAALRSSVELYMQLGTLIIARTTPPPPMLNPFLFMMREAPPPPPAPPVDTPWSQMAIELLDKAVALRSDDPKLWMGIATALLAPRPDLAQRYAEGAVKLAPTDPSMLITLGIVLGLNDHKREGKETLRRAAQLARKQGNPALAQEADAMRREIDSPFLRSSLQMSELFDELGGTDFDDMYF